MSPEFAILRITSGQALGDSAQVDILISEDGELRGISFDPVHTNTPSTVFSAQASTASSLIYSSTGSIIGTGNLPLSGNSNESPFAISGAVSPHNFIAGVFSISGLNETGEFYAVYNANRYERASSIGMLTGAWTLRDSGGNPVGSFNFSSNGTFTGVAPSGCAFTGTASTIDARYNSYRLNLIGDGCSGSPPKTFQGLGTFFDGQTANDSFQLGLSAQVDAIAAYITRY